MFKDVQVLDAFCWSFQSITLSNGMPLVAFRPMLSDISPKNENSVIIYSPLSCCKPVGVSFFCWTQRKIFWRTMGTRVVSHSGIQL